MPVGERTSIDVLQTQHFMFTVDSVTGFFIKCSGLSSENKVIEEKRMADGNKEIVFKQPGRLSWGEMKLDRGITTDMQMWEWRKLVVEGSVTAARKNATLTLLDMSGNPGAEWTIINAWPSKVEGPSFKADDDSIGIESMTLVYESFSRTS